MVNDQAFKTPVSNPAIKVMITLDESGASLRADAIEVNAETDQVPLTVLI